MQSYHFTFFSLFPANIIKSIDRSLVCFCNHIIRSVAICLHSGEEKSRAANHLVVGKVAGQASCIQIYSEIALEMTSTGPSL